MKMDNADVFVLAALQIGAAAAQKLLSPATGLEGMSSVSLEATFQFGSGSGTVTAIVATTMDDGTSWRHIARFDFDTSSAVKQANVQAAAAKGITVYADLDAEGVNDGFLGDQLAVLLTTTGNYSNSVLSVRAAVR
jgi:hypothetical protein